MISHSPALCDSERVGPQRSNVGAEGIKVQ